MKLRMVEALRKKGADNPLRLVEESKNRGISLIKSFNGILTNQEDQKQYLLQVIEKHRKDYPNPNKSTMVT